MAIVKKERGAASSKKKRRDADDEPSTAALGSLVLPTELSVPSERLRDYILLIYGEKKIGKTTLAAQVDNNLFLMTEEGARALKVYKMSVSSWSEAKAILKLLRKDTTYDAVTVDTVDILYTLCEAWVCQKLVITDLGDAEWGAGWRMARKEFTAFMDGLSKLNKGLILLSHADVREVTMRDGAKYDRLGPTMPKIAREICEPMIDVWGYYGYDGRRRVLQLLGDDHVAAGHRLDGRFLAPDGRRVRLLDMGRDPAQAYARLLACFDNTYQPKRESDLDEDSIASPTTKKKLVLKKKTR